MYDPRRLAKLRSEGSVTESFVYTVNNFLYQAEAIVSITVNERTRWHNTTWSVDVNGDGTVDPIDALVLINDINAYGMRTLDDDVDGARSDYFLDVDNDGTTSPLDVLLVINWINRGDSGGEREGGLPSTEADSSWVAMAGLWADLPNDVLRKRRADPAASGSGETMLRVEN
jgi:hypothetical protein